MVLLGQLQQVCQQRKYMQQVLELKHAGLSISGGQEQLIQQPQKNIQVDLLHQQLQS
jgi:hypothetical protein